LDGARFEQLVDAINSSKPVKDSAAKRAWDDNRAKYLQGVVSEHGGDLFAWPQFVRRWLVTDPEAGNFVREHVPGFEHLLADAVGRWHHLAFLGLANQDGSFEYFPF
jgi:hypothetical protein